MDIKKERNLMVACKSEAEETKKKQIGSLIGKIAVIVCIVIYMFCGDYQSIKSSAQYYKNNPEAKSFEQTLAEAVESGRVQAYGPGVNQFVNSQKNATSKRNAAIEKFELLNAGLWIGILVCTGLSGYSIYKIVKANKEIKDYDERLKNLSESVQTVKMKPLFVSEYTEKCNKCGTVQSTGRKTCMKCGTVFR